jgi:pyruvyl transferase EpsO
MAEPPLNRIRAQSRDVLAAAVGRGQPVAVLDYPLHLNAGDTLIYAGTTSYLHELDAQVRYISSPLRYSPEHLRALHPTGPILLNGGGNFGDRWPGSQHFRERVIADFPDRRIVQLPQSIEMSDETAERIRIAYGAHPDLTVLLRESRSMAAARALLPGIDVRYCPDLAFGYTPGSQSPAPRVDVIELKRSDSESAVEGDLFPHDDVTVEVSDWRLTRAEMTRWRALRLPGSLGRRIPGVTPIAYSRLIHPTYAGLTRHVLSVAERGIARGRVVVTDRLHAAVLAALMGRPVVVRDNANHKISAIFSDYLGTLDDVGLAPDAQAAGILVREQLARLSGRGQDSERSLQ